MTIGQLVTPTIRLVRKIGRGGMGTVWAAEDLRLESQVAVKLLEPDYWNDERAVARFRQEAQRAAKVRSPHVTTVFAHGVTDQGEPFIVMELLEGETLEDRLRQRGALPIDEVAELVKQTAKGLVAAHKLGVVHRDIKPGNLFILNNDGEPFVKVVDFGIAKQMDLPPDLTTTNTMVGTPAYMSPEQYMNPKQVDLRTDLWALGIMVYEALTGTRPFSGATMIALAMAITKGRFTPPSALNSGLPTAVDNWMTKALAVDPEKRFSSAKEMADALGKAYRSMVGQTETPAIPREQPDLAFAPTVPTPRGTKLVQPDDDTTQVDHPTVRRRGSSKLHELRFFEGCWVSSEPRGYYYFCIVGDALRAAYCYRGNDQLTGEMHQVEVVGQSLYARFRWPMTKHLKGFMVMHAQSPQTLIGGWWTEWQVPRDIAKNLSKLNGAIPGMNAVTWQRVDPAPALPAWAKTHFASIASPAP
jgi:eukaryotic-like serine/threonine-protein kinase